MEVIPLWPVFSWPCVDLPDSGEQDPVPCYGSHPSVSAPLGLQKSCISGLCLGAGHGPGVCASEAD